MIDDKNAPPVAVRKTLKLSSPKAALPKAEKTLQPAVKTPVFGTSPNQAPAKPMGRSAGPADWADAHKRRMQADMDALNTPSNTRR